MKSPVLLAFAILALCGLGFLLFQLTSGGEGGDTPSALAEGGSQTSKSGSGDSPNAELVSPGDVMTGKPIDSDRKEVRAVTESAPEPKAAVPSGPMYEGRIVDALGNAVAGARVKVNRWSSQSGLNVSVTVNSSTGGGSPSQFGEGGAVTGADGKFTFERKSTHGTNLAVDVLARGFLPAHEKKVLENTDSLDLGTVFLEPGVIVAGQVIDRDGAPIEGAAVRRAENGADVMGSMIEAFDDFGIAGALGEIETDAEGRFELPYELPGELIIAVRHDEFLPGQWQGETPPAGGALTDLVVRLADGAMISGQVLGMPEGKKNLQVGATTIRSAGSEESEEDETTDIGDMLEVAFAPAGEYKVKVEEDGTFRITGLEPGAYYELRAFERRNFIEIEHCSAAVEAAADEAGVVLQFDAGASITMMVVDDATGEPIERFKINANWAGRPAAMRMAGGGTANRKRHPGGRATLIELRPPTDPGSLDVEVSADGFLEHVAEELLVREHAEIDLGVIRMKAAPRLRILVIDAATKEPVRRARVRLAEETSVVIEGLPAAGKASRGKTDREGRCELSIFRAEKATLTVDAKGYAPHRHEDFTLVGAGAQDWTVQLSEGASVTIKVLDPAGVPVANAFVRTRGPGSSAQPKKTNEEGILELSALLPGDYSFRAQREMGIKDFSIEFEGREKPVDEEGWERVTLSDGASIELVLHVGGVGKLTGVVSANGLPLADARVSLLRGDTPEEEIIDGLSEQFGSLMNGTSHATTTNESGRYTLEGVPADSYILRVSHSGRAMSVTIPAKVSGRSTRIDVELPMTTVRGRVIGPDGEPVAEASINARRASDATSEDVEELEALQNMGFFGNSGTDSATTDADGLFVLEGVAADTKLRIHAKASGFAPVRSDVMTLKADEVREGVELTLAEGGSIRATVTGDPIPFSMVSARFLGEGPAKRRLALVRGGRAVLTGLTPGSWKVWLNANDEDGGAAEEEAQTVKVVAGQETVITLEP